MKKLFAMSAMLSVLCTFTAAQKEEGSQFLKFKTPEEQIEYNTNQLATVLSLTADQKKKVKTVEIDLNKQMSERVMKVLGDKDAQFAILDDIDKLREEKYNRY